MVIIDNAVYSFGFQIDNGIPIIPFYNNPEDQELLHLMNYLNSLAFFEDMREQNAKAFQLKELENADITDYLEYFFGGDQQSSAQEDTQGAHGRRGGGPLKTQEAIKEEEYEEGTSQVR